MSTTTGHLSRLAELAQERSSDKRRALLHDMSELFLESAEVRGDDASSAIVEDILITLAHDMEASVRAELAERFADHPDAPEDLVNDLARDVIEVARPLLARSTKVRDETLVESVRLHGASHARVIANRDEVSESVAEAVAETRDDEALVTLARNDAAQLSRAAMEHLVDHAETCPELHEPLVEHQAIDPDLLNELFFVVKTTLRERILERHDEFDPDTLEAAFAAAQERLERTSGAQPADYDDAVRYVAAKKLRRKLTHELLAELLLQGELTKFTVAFGDTVGLSYAAARRSVDSPSIDPLAIACRSAAFSRDDFVRIAMLRPTSAARQEADADLLGKIYESLPESAAQRVMRFVKLRDREDSAA